MHVSSSAQTASDTFSYAPSMAWENYYGHGEAAFVIVQTNDEGYAFVAKGWSFQMWHHPPELFKLDSSGKMQWSKTIDFSATSGLVQTSDGGYIMAGNIYTGHPNAGLANASLIKADERGNLQWNKTYPTLNYVTSMAQTSDGGFVLSSNTNFPYKANIPSNVALIKTDPYGNLQWINTYGEPGNINLAQSVIQTNEGSYLLVGSTSFNGTTDPPDLYFWLVKTDSKGNLTWSRSYGKGPGIVNTNSRLNSQVDAGLNRGVYGDNEGFSVVQTSDGGYVFLGASYPQDESDNTTFLAKVDFNGEMMWNKTFQGNTTYPPKYLFTPGSLIQTSDGGLAFAGQRLGLALVVKTDGYGNMQWNKTFGRDYGQGLFEFGARSIIETRDGSLVFVGYANGGLIYSGRYYLGKIETALPLPTPSPTPVPTAPVITEGNSRISAITILAAILVLLFTGVFLVVYFKSVKTEGK